MKKVLIIIILLSLLILEGIAMVLLPTNIFISDMYIIPHWVFLFILLVNVFFDNEELYFSITLAIVFGLLIDVVYTDLLGVYMFVYPLAIYIVNLIKQFFQANFYITVVYYLVSFTIIEMMIYIIYSFVDLINITYILFIWDRLIPTIIANFIFLLVLYPIFSKRLVKWKLKESKD